MGKIQMYLQLSGNFLGWKLMTLCEIYNYMVLVNIPYKGRKIAYIIMSKNDLSILTWSYLEEDDV